MVKCDFGAVCHALIFGGVVSNLEIKYQQFFNRSENFGPNFDIKTKLLGCNLTVWAFSLHQSGVVVNLNRLMTSVFLRKCLIQVKFSR